MVLTFRHSQPSRISIPVEPDPADVALLARQAAILAGQGDMMGAMRCYQVALLMDEERADLWVNYGLLQERSGQIADALESFEFALRLDDAMYTARYRAARMYYELGRPLEALDQFKLVTQQRPGYLPAWRYVVQITWALGNLTDAEKHAREALGHAHDPEISSMLGHIEEDGREG